MKKRNSAEAMADQLHSAAVHLLRGLRRADTEGGISAARLSALSVVTLAGPITLGDLAAAEQVRAPTMTRIVNALEQQGLVARQRDEIDRRNVYIVATVRGKRLFIVSRNRRIRQLAVRIEKLGAQEQVLLEMAIPVLLKTVRETARAATSYNGS